MRDVIPYIPALIITAMMFGIGELLQRVYNLYNWRFGIVRFIATALLTMLVFIFLQQQ